MIEIICDRDEEIKDMLFRELPKNVRQIGDTKEKRKIYIEDFVVTYLNKLAKPDHAYARGAILLGDIYQTEEGIAVFISGAIEAQNLELDMDETIFNETVWQKLLVQRDNFFPGQEVVGWFLSRIGFSVEMNQKIIKAHLNNFPGNHKVLYMMDSLENEDAFYMCENQQLLRQKGYYIYYEKNSSMREYMLAGKEEEDRQGERDEKQEQIRRDRKVVRNYRRVNRYGRENKKQSLQIRLTRAASMLVIVGTLGYALYEMRGDAWIDQDVKSSVTETMAGLQSMVQGKERHDDKDKVTTSVETGMNEASQENRTEDKTDQSGDMDSKQQGQDNSEGEADTAQESAKTDTAETAGKETAEKKEETDTQTTKGKDQEDTAGMDGKTQETASLTQGKPLYYTVQKGDTLAGISRRMYTTDKYATQIAKANQLADENEIYIGQKILIPSIE